MSGFRLIQTTIIVLLAAVLAGCASQNVNWDYDPRQEPGELRTYAWLQSNKEIKEKGYQFDALTDQRVHEAVNQVLHQQGYQQLAPSASDQADFLVNYLTRVKNRREEQQVTTQLGYGFSPWGMGATTDFRVQEYEEGILIIDVIEPDTKKVLWRGAYRSRIRDNQSPQERAEKINQAVAAILQGFPRPPEK